MDKKVLKPNFVLCSNYKMLKPIVSNCMARSIVRLHKYAYIYSARFTETLILKDRNMITCFEMAADLRKKKQGHLEKACNLHLLQKCNLLQLSANGYDCLPFATAVCHLLQLFPLLRLFAICYSCLPFATAVCHLLQPFFIATIVCHLLQLFAICYDCLPFATVVCHLL